VMSANVWTGSAQFAAVSILAAGGGAAYAVLAAAILNLRYGAMSIALAPSLPRPWPVRALYALAIADESWALALRPDGTFDRTVLAGAAAALYVTWVCGTVVGAAAGDVVGDPERLGLDAAFPALFLALLWPRLAEERGAVVAVAGALITLVLTPLVPVGVAVVAASTAVVFGLPRR
jgi:predicted branched-subunit amino acid permease